MSIKSKEEIIRKRNQELASENEDLKRQIEDIQSRLDEIAKMTEHDEVKQKIDELEKLRCEWSAVVVDLENQREKYNNLIQDLQIVKEIMIKKGFKVPWFQKFFDQFQKD